MSLEHGQDMKDRGPVRKRGRSYSVQEIGFFEGAEKLLEMWFDVPRGTPPAKRGLRVIPRSARSRHYNDQCLWCTCEVHSAHLHRSAKSLWMGCGFVQNAFCQMSTISWQFCHAHSLIVDP